MKWFIFSVFIGLFTACSDPQTTPSITPLGLENLGSISFYPDSAWVILNPSTLEVRGQWVHTTTGTYEREVLQKSYSYNSESEEWRVDSTQYTPLEEFNGGFRPDLPKGFYVVHDNAAFKWEDTGSNGENWKSCTTDSVAYLIADLDLGTRGDTVYRLQSQSSWENPFRHKIFSVAQWDSIQHCEQILNLEPYTSGIFRRIEFEDAETSFIFLWTEVMGSRQYITLNVFREVPIQ